MFLSFFFFLSHHHLNTEKEIENLIILKQKKNKTKKEKKQLIYIFKSTMQSLNTEKSYEWIAVNAASCILQPSGKYKHW